MWLLDSSSFFYMMYILACFLVIPIFFITGLVKRIVQPTYHPNPQKEFKELINLKHAFPPISRTSPRPLLSPTSFKFCQIL